MYKGFVPYRLKISYDCQCVKLAKILGGVVLLHYRNETVLSI